MSVNHLALLVFIKKIVGTIIVAKFLLENISLLIFKLEVSEILEMS